MTATFDRALELYRSGRQVEGESLLVKAVAAAAGAAGTAPRGLGLLGKLQALIGVGRKEADVPASPAHAEALFDLARYLMMSSDLPRALPSLRKAAALAPTDPDARRARITYALNLGQVLEVLGELGEAEAVLRANVAERRDFYGEGSEGLAWGLWPLAGVVLGAKRSEEARALARQALDILWKAGSVHATSVLPILGAAEAAAGHPPPWGQFLGSLPDELWVRAMQAGLERLGQVHTPSAAVAAHQLVSLCAELPSPSDSLPDAWARLARGALAAEATDVAEAAARAYIALQEKRGVPREAIGGVEALAEALEKAGKLDEAVAAWADAEARARALGDRLVLAHTLRNRGLFLADGGAEGWRPMLEESLSLAEAAGAPGNAEELVRSRAALGIRLQHLGELPRAGELLAAALAQGEQVLPPADPLLFTIRTHAQALRAGKTCGCGPGAEDEQRRAVEKAVLALTQAALPPGLLGGVELTPEGEWSVHLARAPRDQGEVELVGRALQQALAKVRAQAD